jgi:hypothetical protein
MRQITISLTKRSIAKTVGFCVLGFMLVFAGMVAGTSLMYNDVKKEGYNAALTDVSDLLFVLGTSFLRFHLLLALLRNYHPFVSCDSNPTAFLSNRMFQLSHTYFLGLF